VNEIVTPVDILEEELPSKISMLLIGPPGCGKTIFSQQLMYKMLQNGHSVIVMSSKSQIDLISSKNQLFTWDVQKYIEKNQLGLVDISNVADPTELNISLSRVLGIITPPLSLVVVDSLTVLMVSMEQNKIMKFTEGLIRKLQDKNINTLLLATPTKETEDFLIKVKSLVSAIIEIDLKDTGTLRRYTRIFKYSARKHSTQWYPFEISDEGIQFAASSVRIPDTFLFDLDGTLVTMELDFGAIRQEVDKILIKGGYPEDQLDEHVSTLETIGNAVEYLKKTGLEWKKVQKDALSYLEQSELEAAAKAVLIKGAHNVLQTLKEKKKKVGVITRNQREVALQVLKKCGLLQYVDMILARDDVGKVKPHPDHVLQAIKKLGSVPEKTVVLGDHHFEIEAGNKAGCFTVGFLSGSGNRETLQEAGVILNSVQDLEDILTKMVQ
jgi:phosphoglycolate phosphatase